MTLSTTALAHYDAPKLAAALERAEARIRELEQENNALRTEMRWIDRLLAVPAQVMSPSQKVTLRAAVKAYRQGTPDEKGFVQLESWKLCKTVGQSKDTFLDNLTYCTEKLGILQKRTERILDSDTNTYSTNLSIGVTNLLAHPQHYRVDQPRNHGGERQICPHCQSDRLQRKITVTCIDCGAVLDTHISEVNKSIPDDHPMPGIVNLTTSRTNALERQVDVSEDAALVQPATPPVSA